MAGNANSGSKREKLIGDALRVAAKRVHEGDPQGRIKLAVAAAKIVDLACDGDIAFAMIVSTGDPSFVGIDQYGG